MVLCQCQSPTSTETKSPAEKVLILGNSITQQGQYVSMLQYLLHAYRPDLNLDMISIGLASETVSCLTEPDHPFPRPCLKERLDRALTKVKPDLVIACYGMNDGIYHPFDSLRFEAFQLGIQHLMAKTNDIGARLVILTPPPFDPIPIVNKVVPMDAPEFGYQTPYAEYDQLLTLYSEWLMTLPADNLTVINLHRDLVQKIKARRQSNPAFTIAQDGIHPNNLGHAWIAASLASYWQIEQPELVESEVEALLATDIFQSIDSTRKSTSQKWLVEVGYIRGDTVGVVR